MRMRCRARPAHPRGCCCELGIGRVLGDARTPASLLTRGGLVRGSACGTNGLKCRARVASRACQSHAATPTILPATSNRAPDRRSIGQVLPTWATAPITLRMSTANSERQGSMNSRTGRRGPLRRKRSKRSGAAPDAAESGAGSGVRESQLIPHASTASPSGVGTEVLEATKV